MEKKPFPQLPILLVDDEETWTRRLAFTLKRSAGIDHVIFCQDSREVMDLLARREVGLILLDLTMPHISGEGLLPLIAEEYPEIPVLILSGLNQLETAVECMKAGAFDYFVKTVETERLIGGIFRALDMVKLRKENRRLKARFVLEDVEKPEAFSEIVTADGKLRALFRFIEAVGGSSEPVLITGESGVGKELFARSIWKVSRPDDPWVAVNVAGLDDNVFSDTLFGHCRGAFTGADKDRPGMVEKAGDGILFLDEIGDLSLTSQVKLLRLLQEGEYHPLGSDRPRKTKARIVVATNQDLAARQKEGSFRKDLYYRLCSHHIAVPPLRERGEDIALLLEYFLQQAAESLGKKKPTPPPELPVLLSTYHFPGNIRELRGMVFNAVSLHRGGKLSMEVFKSMMGMPDGQEERPSCSSPELALTFSSRMPTFKESEELLVAEALRRSKGIQKIAAGLLGISPQALSVRLKKSSN